MRKMLAIGDIIAAVNGRLINAASPFPEEVFISAVSSDSRTIEEGSLYIALKGERFDGHDFISDAMRKGAAAAVADDISKVPEGVPAIITEDTLTALGKIAGLYREKLNAKVIAVTGSVGKTTTRRMIEAALFPSFKVWATKANLNNEIGLPSTVLGAPDDTEVMILEMGMRGLGQISYLTGIAKPDIALITNIGYSHVGILGSRENIRQAKCEITEGLKPGGSLIIKDDPFLKDYVKSSLPPDRNLIVIKDDEIRNMHIGIPGEHNALNACFAVKCAQLLNADLPKAKEALQSFVPVDGRGKISKSSEYTIINDAYNASPESMAAAFKNLNSVNEGSRKLAVLGGMLELGDLSGRLHEMTGRECGKYDFDLVIVTGDEKEAFIKGMKEAGSRSVIIPCKDTYEVRACVLDRIMPGDTVLFKASHSFGFEKICGELTGDEQK